MIKQIKEFAHEKPRIRVKHIVLGTHMWPEAEEVFPEVGFLQHEHHHDFHVYVECNVNHHDREIEFIMLRIELMKMFDRYYDGDYVKRFGTRSCEMIAADVRDHLKNIYGDRSWKVSVFEDDIQGGIIED